MSSAARKSSLMLRPETATHQPPVGALGWSTGTLAAGLAELGQRAGLAPAALEQSLAAMPAGLHDATELDRYVRWLAESSGMTAEAVEAPAAGVAAMLGGSLPAVLRLYFEGEPVFLLLLKAKGRLVTVIGPDGGEHRIALEAVADALLAGHEAPLRHDIERVLDRALPQGAARAASVAAIARARLGAKPIGGLWALGLSAAAPVGQSALRLGLHWMALGLLLAFGLSYLIEITGWRLMGEAILGGRADPGWLLAWALLLVSAVPVRFLGQRINARLTLSASGIIKTRLIAGALALDGSQLRHKGAGQVLAQVLESQAFEALAVNGGFAALIALIELAAAAAILVQGAGAGLVTPLLGLWIAMIAALGVRYYRRLVVWSGDRLGLTHEMVERMAGHRTVLAQEPRERRERSTDLRIRQYHATSRALDAAVIPFLASLPSGWSIAALAALTPDFVTGAATPPGIAVALGGILFAGRAINTICSGIAGIARAAVAWKHAAPLFAAGARKPRPSPFIPTADAAFAGAAPVIEAQDLTFSHDAAGPAVLDGASLTIRHGDRLLLEGRSGGGKSTLASLLSGLRRPQSGLLLLNGLDRQTLGSAWHRVATEAPQFHENHILSAPLAFNLLMGRRWPATEEDLAEARDVCEELGLGGLLERMPAGLMQMVGETGWQMSHGEKSRVFLARALLQKAAFTILDESFAALDPETLRRCMDCAAKRAGTLMVIAHP